MHVEEITSVTNLASDYMVPPGANGADAVAELIVVRQGRMVVKLSTLLMLHGAGARPAARPSSGPEIWTTGDMRVRTILNEVFGPTPNIKDRPARLPSTRVTYIELAR